jgi:hypothetical protein
VGQLHWPDGCPVCEGDNGGRGTCDPCAQTVQTFRGLIRGLQEWRSGYEAGELPEVITDPAGRQWSIWDVERFYALRDQQLYDEAHREWRYRIPRQMARALELFLYDNMLERDAAVAMGVSPSNPIGTYATVGLAKMLHAAREQELPGIDFEFEVDMDCWQPDPEAAVPDDAPIAEAA